ncbi:MAG: c-type cytochrome [Acidobacteriota bacterium]
MTTFRGITRHRARRLAALAALAVSLGLRAGGIRAQDASHGYTQADIERGGQTYLLSCGSCHGPTGDLVAAVNLFGGTFRRATSDQEIVGLIRSGIPGTPMPPSSLSEADAMQIVAFLRSRPGTTTAARTSGLPGNAGSGARLYATLDCATCHMINGAGGYLGPDLSSMGITRPVDELERALTKPSIDIRNGNRTVTVLRASGPALTGRLLNQDTYSLQFMDATGRLTSVRKDDVRRWEVMATSPMPAYGDTLTPQQIADVVSYLQTLNAPPQSGGVAGTQRGGGPRGGGAPAPPANGRGGRGGPP